jgi:hypothetical protein
MLAVTRDDQTVCFKPFSMNGENELWRDAGGARHGNIGSVGS